MNLCSEPPRPVSKLPNAPAYDTTIIQKAAPVFEPSQFTAKDPQDRVLTLLQRVLEEQVNLRRVLEDNQQVIVPRLDELSASVSALCTQQQQEHIKVEEELEQVEKEVVKVGSSVALAQGQNSGHTDGTHHHTHALEEIRKKPAPPPKSLIARILSNTYFEVGIAMVILLNTIVMFISLQLKGLHAGWVLELRDDPIDIAKHDANFDIMEHLFNVVYVIELVMRIWVFRWRFPRSISNLVDFGIVVCSCLDAYVFRALNIQVINISVLRMIRLTRILRLGKVLRSSSFFSELRVLIRTLYIALRGVLWSVILLSCIITTGGIIMAQLAINLLENESIDLERRIWMYKNFGTTMASIYTMFESTLTTSWIQYSRPLIEEVGYLFVFFWMPWVVLVNFTTMRVVSALFLKETMGVSAADAEKCAMMQLKNKSKSAEYLREIFTNADTSGDGAINQDEFEEMMTDVEVVETFAYMGLDTDEVAAFYTVLAADDGVADYNEFITGALGMASSAPNLDRMKSMQNQLKIKDSLGENNILLHKVCQHLKLDVPPSQT